MFDKTVVALLEGEFICHTKYPDSFSQLKNESFRRQVNGYLTQIDRRLATTAHGDAYYMAYQKIEDKDREEIRLSFKKIKGGLRSVLHLLNLIMQAQCADQSIGAGDVIDFPKILHLISESPHLSEKLRELPSHGKEFVSSDSSLSALLNRALQHMEKAGYLIQENKGDRYRVTGKIDYLYEVVDFLTENEQSIRELEDHDPEVEKGENGRLF